VAPNRFKRTIGVLLMALVVSSVAAIAQQQPAQNTSAAGSPAADTTQAPKYEFFGGYSWIAPRGYYDADFPLGVGYKMPSINRGFGLAATRNMGNVLGVTLDYSGHWQDGNNIQTFMVGPQVKWRAENFQPFGHIMVGGLYLSPNNPNTEAQWQAGLMAGGGFDLLVNPHWAVRVFQADYIYTNWTTNTETGYPRRWNPIRLQGGLVYNFGLPAPSNPPAAACSAQPSAVMAGEPIKVTATPSNFNPKRTLGYTWNSTGGKVEGTDANATVDTNGLAPGTYTVKATISDNRKKNPEVAECNATFTINEPPKHPPTISCTANPTTVRAGDPVNVSCTGNSPDGRPLTYNHTSTNGKLTPNGANATLDTTGLSAGPVTVNSTVSDDRGLTASTSTNATIEVPPPPPTASKLNEITFPNKQKPARVDNTAKAILDDVALRLQREPDSKAVVVGYATADETKRKVNKNLAAQRAINTKACLDGAEASCENQGKQIDPSRIDVRTGTGDENKAEIWIVPSGANFTGEGTTPVDESKVKVQARTAATAAHHKAKKATK
jgi:outer membrane protein OmpA-like peptidoglycan-associated protein